MPASLPTPMTFPASVPNLPPLVIELPLLTAGKVLFVDDSLTDVARDAASHGQINRPYKTIAYALTQTKAARGDTIVCGPNHSQTVATALALTATAMVNIVMLKFGVVWTMGSVAGSFFTMTTQQNVSGPIKAWPGNATQTIFTVVGGMVRLVELYGIVTTVIQSAASTLKFSSLATGLSAVDLSTTVDLNAAAVGTVVSMDGTLADAAIASANQTHVAQAGAVDVGPGAVNVIGAAVRTGNIQYYCSYIPLAPGAYIVAV